MRTTLLPLLLASLVTPALAATPSPGDVKDNYLQYCAACHGPERLGGWGPVLLPDNLHRLKKDAAYAAIADGLPATQMPGFKDKLSEAEMKALAEWIYTPPTHPPKWDEADIRRSHIVHKENLRLPLKPVFEADPLNVTLVVEHGDNHITVLDGDKMEPFHRFETRHSLHGGPKFTPDGHYVYWASRDGWITKYDLLNLKVVAEIRAGINTRNLAVSSDGKVVMVANYLPNALVALDADDLSLVKVIPVQDKNGKGSRVSAVYDARPRGSFIAALKDIPEVWEIVYDKEKGGPVYTGLVHDHQYKEAIEAPGPLPIRKTELEDYLDDFFFDQSYTYLLGASRSSPKGQVVFLPGRRKLADLELTGMPHLGSGITFDYDGKRVMASPNLKDNQITVIDLKTWKTVKTIPTLGPGFFLRSHEETPYAWADVFSGPEKDAMLVIDKRTLEVVKVLRPEPGKTSTHVEFDRYGKYALVSIWEHDGALVIYDAKTLEEVKRLPMKRPVGKYNVWNKTRLSEGTSH